MQTHDVSAQVPRTRLRSVGFALLWLALTLVAVLMALVIAVLGVLRPQQGEWQVSLAYGPLHAPVSVPALARMATHPVGISLLDGRSLSTRMGTLSFTRLDVDRMAIHCAPCRIQIPGNIPGKVPGQVADGGAQALPALDIDLRAQGWVWSGTLTSGPLRANWRGEWSHQAVAFGINSADIPIAELVALAGAALPQAPQLVISGTAGLNAVVRLSWPAPNGGVNTDVRVLPRIEGFAVAGLGTEALKDWRPGARCDITVPKPEIAPPLTDAAASAANAELSATAAGAPDTPPAPEPVPSSLPSTPAPAPDFGPWLPQAVLAAEDQRFFSHPGYDLAELSAALAPNQAAQAAQTEHGSAGAAPMSITRQLARLLYVGHEPGLSGTLHEVLYAAEMERTLGKARILELYLAVAPWGAGTCGGEAAARHYFRVSARKLTELQAAALAAMLHNPELEAQARASSGNIKTARTEWVLHNMHHVAKPQYQRLSERFYPQFGQGQASNLTEKLALAN